MMTGQTAYLDCFSGISGDMFLGALIDAGFPEDILRTRLQALSLGNYELTCTRPEGMLSSTRVVITTMGEQPPRSWKAIRRLIADSSLPGPVIEKSLTVFQLLAAAEARIHGCDEEEVHFHELGSVDTIIDIVGSVCGLEFLRIDQLISSPLPMPRGWVSCEHGLLPVPAPAVLEVLRDVPVIGVDLDLEMVTPTGAALVKGLCSGFGQFPSMVINAVGYGCGSRTFSDNRPNLLRIVLGRTEPAAESQQVEVVETNLDDWSPEGFPLLTDRLFAKGALDVSLVPMQMKKGRPGFLLRVIVDPARAWEVKTVILSETTAIGLRYRTEQRLTLPRKTGTIDTRWGMVQVKRVETPSGPVLYPEYEDCRRVAVDFDVSLQEVYREIARHSPDVFREDT